ncbi:hypothetical protein BYT27DRAFT_7204409 [Phlegmacium glaucopus]|nr:hypothetical protein BYT27DRAFT_7204409 [Phlegmacium glaucopus]
MTSSHLPPLSSSGVFSVSSSSLIDAPLEKVWSIMLDFPSYNKWNSFVRRQVLMNASKEPLLDQTPREGDFIQMSVHIPPTMQEPGLFGRGSAFVKITTIDHANHRAAWCTEGIPRFLLHTERWQALSVDEVTGKTKYETIEVFGGLFGYFVKFFVGKNLALGFKAGADCLKKCAEEASPQ